MSWPKIDEKVSGEVVENIPRVGYVFNIGAPSLALMPLEHFGLKKLARLRVGDHVSYLKVVDVDFAADDHNKIILSGEELLKDPLATGVSHSLPVPAQHPLLEGVKAVRGVAEMVNTMPPTISAAAKAAAARTLAEPATQLQHKLKEKGTRRRRTKRPGYQQAPESGMGITDVVKLDCDVIHQLRSSLLATARDIGISPSQLQPVLRSLDELLELDAEVIVEKSPSVSTWKDRRGPSTESISGPKLLARRKRSASTPPIGKQQGYHEVRSTQQRQERAPLNPLNNPHGIPLENIVVGSRMDGIVEKIEPNLGIFFDVGAVKCGLMLWRHVTPDTPKFEVGDTVEDLLVEKVDLPKKRFWLSTGGVTFCDVPLFERARSERNKGTRS